MHLALLILTTIAAWRWGNWKEWNKYQHTMVYVAMGNLLYNFIYYNHFLWLLKPDFFNHVIGELIYTFIIFPLTVLLFLSGLPGSLKGQAVHIGEYVLVYIVIEWIFHIFGGIEYNYGWNIWWSLAWDCMMFTMWVIHYKKPTIAYLLSLITVIIIVLLFPVDLNLSR